MQSWEGGGKIRVHLGLRVSLQKPNPVRRASLQRFSLRHHHGIKPFFFCTTQPVVISLETCGRADLHPVLFIKMRGTNKRCPNPRCIQSMCMFSHTAVKQCR